MDIAHLDLKLIHFFRKTYLPVARISLFVIFFWFGLVKLLGLSEASPLALALTERTVGAAAFDTLFMLLAVVECVIGLLFLFPKLVRITIPLLLFHMTVVCSPLILVPEMAWQAPLVPTLEGQYIIKNVVVIAVALGIAAHVEPLITNRKRSM